MPRSFAKTTVRHKQTDINAQLNRPSFIQATQNIHKAKRAKRPKEKLDNCHIISFYKIRDKLSKYLNGEESKLELGSFILLINPKLSKAKLDHYIHQVDNGKAQSILRILNSSVDNLEPGERRKNRQIGRKYDLKRVDKTLTPRTKAVLENVTPDKNMLPLDRHGNLLSSRTENDQGQLGNTINPKLLTPDSKELIKNFIEGKPSLPRKLFFDKESSSNKTIQNINALTLN